ncbi:MAG: HD domain-containing protein [Promethearchaeota archaeon]
MKTLTGLNAEKEILDPIHGPIPITPIELKIISTPVFQRLRYITQLSLTSLVFPGATHNRFQHSLGTLHVMDKLLYTLKLEEFLPALGENHQRIIQTMRLAALLHDCGHLPFSHTFENLYEPGTHELFGKYIIERSQIGKLLNEISIDPKNIGALIMGDIPIVDENSKLLTELLPLLHSDADADRMDYLLRDAYYTGVPYGNVDLNRICNYVRLFDGHICFHEKSQGALEDFLYSRYQMYKIVYIHKTVVCYELILHKIYQIFQKYKDLIKIPFLLPDIDNFKESSKDWYDNYLFFLNEASFFESIRILMNAKETNDSDRNALKNLFLRIVYRLPIKNCFRFDDLAEISKTEYCDKDAKLYEKLEEDSKLVNHWSFLRHDPSNPIRIATPIKREVDDQQDFSQIRILKLNSNLQKEIHLLQNLTNSVIRSLARHHRVLICYYHNEKKAQNKIASLAKEMIY